MQKCMAVLLTAFLLLGMTACGGEPGDSSVTTTDAQTDGSTNVDSGTTTEAQTVGSTNAGSKPGTTTETTAETFSNNLTDIHQLQAGVDYVVGGEQLFTIRSSDPAFAKIQGAYFDGERHYIAATRQLEGGYEDARILVVSNTGKLLRESEPLTLDHANNITFNPHIGQLVVSHCHSPDGHYYRYSFVDPETLTITRTEDKEQPFFSMAYSPEKLQYASARWDGETLDFWDQDMNHLKTVDVEWPPTLSQGVFCDAQGVYFVRSERFGYPSEIRIYDWNGNLTKTMPLFIPDNPEPESINIVGNTAYVVADDGKGSAVVYSLYFEEW